MTTSLATPTPANAALRQSPIPALRKLRAEETEAAIVISGRVTSYYFKQLAQETLMPVLNNRELHNRVVVDAP
jgi:hypothetical protein